MQRIQQGLRLYCFFWFSFCQNYKIKTLAFGSNWNVNLWASRKKPMCFLVLTSVSLYLTTKNLPYPRTWLFEQITGSVVVVTSDIKWQSLYLFKGGPGLKLKCCSAQWAIHKFIGGSLWHSSWYKGVLWVWCQTSLWMCCCRRSGLCLLWN